MRVHQYVCCMLGRLPGCALMFFFLLFAHTHLANAQQAINTNRLTVPPPKPDSISITTNLTSVFVTVSDDRGRFISGLDKDAFEVYEDGVRQEIGYFSSSDIPLSVGVIFDLSGSMDESKLERAREALKRFIQTSHDEDEYFLAGFNERLLMFVDWTRDGDAILKRLNGVKTSGQTALFDAVAFGLEQVPFSYYPRRALIVISDGEDNFSRTTRDKLKRMVQESDAIIYSIGIQDYLALKEGADTTLKNLSEKSGGRAFFPKNVEDMFTAFEQIALELRHQYSIGYAPSSFVTDGRWRKIKVKLSEQYSTSRWRIRNRAGYYALPGHLGIAASDKDER